MNRFLPQTFKQIAGYYDGLVDRYGHDPRAADYGHAGSQAIKFRVLADVLPLDGASVLDVGCGLGNFSDYLSSRYRDVSYHGIDISPRMVEEARKLHPDRDIRQANLAALEGCVKYDLVTANGIFYLLGQDAWAVMQHLVERMFDLSLRGGGVQFPQPLCADAGGLGVLCGPAADAGFLPDPDPLGGAPP